MRERVQVQHSNRPALVISGLLFIGLQAAWASPPFQDEMSVLKSAITAFDESASFIEQAHTVLQMTTALRAAAMRLRAALPDMVALTRTHPDWGRNPPDALQQTMNLFHEASRRFLVDALRYAVEFTNRHPDAPDLRDAFAKVNQILYRL
jgi:hypothetical protein